MYYDIRLSISLFGAVIYSSCVAPCGKYHSKIFLYKYNIHYNYIQLNSVIFHFANPNWYDGYCILSTLLCKFVSLMRERRKAVKGILDYLRFLRACVQIEWPLNVHRRTKHLR